jgi:hypothetical protein
LPKKLWEGIKSVGGWVAKLFGVNGGGNDTASADTGAGSDAMGNPVLSSQVDSSGSVAQEAVTRSAAAVQADAAAAQQQTSDDMRRLVEVNQQQAAQMERVVNNTGQTKDAVERNGTAY